MGRFQKHPLPSIQSKRSYLRSCAQISPGDCHGSSSLIRSTHQAFANDQGGVVFDGFE